MSGRGSIRAPLCVALMALLASACTDDAPTPGPAPSMTAPSTTTSGTEAFSWRRIAPRRAGFDPARLEVIARDARTVGTSCLVVVREGRLVAEEYWNGGAAGEPLPVWSVTKSVTSTLVGIAQSDGDLDIDHRAARYVPQWRGTPAAGVTIRNLLSNDSGRERSQTSDYVGLIDARDRTSYAVGLRQQHPPGTVWAYNNAAIQTLDRVLRSATGSETAEYAEERLFDPLGMDDTRMTGDASGRSTTTSFGLESTCRDLARFGLLFAQQGSWADERLLPRSWIREAVGGPSQRLNDAYGLLWWLNRSGMALGAPDDLYAALGLGGQVVLVDPGSQTVVVRLAEVSSSDDYSMADAARVVTEALVTR